MATDSPDHLAEVTRLSVHEAAHCVAGYLFEHPISGVSIDPPAGQAQVAERRDCDLDETVTEIAICLIGNVATQTSPWPAILDDPDGPESDEAAAIRKATAFPGVMGGEIPAIVDLGKARAHGLTHREDFQRCLQALAPRLAEERHIDGPTIERIFDEALGLVPA